MKRVALILALLVGCGPSSTLIGGGDGGTSGDDDDDNPGTPDAGPDPGVVGTVSGTVWAPGNAPGMVPSGHEIPIFDALVYLSLTPPAPIPQNVYCEQCQDPPGKAIRSDHDGHFVIDNVVPSTYWMVIQKGQFRVDQQIVVGEGVNLALPPDKTTLPSVHDPANGQWVPRIALASGLYDQMEDIFGKMGLGQVDSYGMFEPSSAAGNFDVYSNGGNADVAAIGTLSELMSNYSRMEQYHIIFIPCSWAVNIDGLQGSDPTVRRNIREWVKAGGKLYVTDWSGEWSDNVFPAEVQFAADHDTPASAWNPTTETWDPNQFGDADGSPPYESQHARAEDPDLASWLDGQQGPRVSSFGGYDIGTYNGGDFVIEGNWDHIVALPNVQIGQDDEGLPIYDQAHAFIIGDEDGGAVDHPLTVTFEPVGCGRVLYSTYHTAENTHVGLVPQERVLLYLIMEIGVCKSGPIVD